MSLALRARCTVCGGQAASLRPSSVLILITNICMCARHSRLCVSVCVCVCACTSGYYCLHCGPINCHFYTKITLSNVYTV